MAYDIGEHIHNFAVWTASRAVQRGWKGAKTKNIKLAIESSGIRSDIKKTGQNNISSEKFDSFHEKWSKKIIDFLTKEQVQTSYGRVAKIIAIYIKTAVVIKDNGERPLSKVAHPPIDNTLLENLNKVQAYQDLKIPKSGWDKNRKRRISKTY